MEAYGHICIFLSLNSGEENNLCILRRVKVQQCGSNLQSSMGTVFFQLFGAQSSRAKNSKKKKKNKQNKINLLQHTEK